MNLFQQFQIFKEKLKKFIEIRKISINVNLLKQLTDPYRPGTFEF